MKRVLLLSIFCIVSFLTGCDALDRANAANYKIIAKSGLGESILLNQSTGETWRLTEDGWVPIVKLPKISESREEPTLNELKAEMDRRKKIYRILDESPDAKKIALDYQLAVVKQEAARSSLQALIPKSLGVLPPNVEKGNWKEFLEKHN